MKYLIFVLLKIHNFFWKLIDYSWVFIKKNNGSKRIDYTFSIGIVTYVDRYDLFFKPLIKNLITLFPNTQFVIAINGYYDIEKQNQYLKEIKLFLGTFQNVKIVAFQEPQSLSKLWNLLIKNSETEKTFIFNDDIKVSWLFRKFLYSSKILSENIALINRSWSHFLISKTIIKQVGWFDERFPGVGNEDEDYECRLVFNDIEIKSFRLSGVKNVSFITKNFSYGANTESINVKYVKENKLFFDKKWDTTGDSREGFKYVAILRKYAKLKPGMETPNFYND